MEEQTLDIAKIVRLVPPKLDPAAIFKKAVCIRPMREGRFLIDVDRYKNKQIVHCYGMGGSGWTTLFGSVGKAIRLFQKDADKKKPIRVIGAGCMGLTAAIELSRLGFTVRGVLAKEIYDIPSWKAAGYFAFVSLQTAPEEQADLEKIGIETFKTYQRIHKGNHPYIDKKAVRYLPVYGGRNTELGLEAMAQHGLIPPREEVILDFGAVQHESVKYMTYFMETTQIMQNLTAEIERLGIPIEQREVSSWEEVKEEVIFNCSGLGGRELNNDADMIPVRGHIMLLNESSGTGHLDYLIYTSVMQDGKEEYIYLFPKSMAVSPEYPEGVPCQGILGGTFITDECHDEHEFKKMLERSFHYFYGKP